jgi:hypothetical protein
LVIAIGGTFYQSYTIETSLAHFIDTKIVVREHTKAPIMHKEAVEDESELAARLIDGNGSTVEKGLDNHSRHVQKHLTQLDLKCMVVVGL